MSGCGFLRIARCVYELSENYPLQIRLEWDCRPSWHPPQHLADNGYLGKNTVPDSTTGQSLESSDPLVTAPDDKLILMPACTDLLPYTPATLERPLSFNSMTKCRRREPERLGISCNVILVIRISQSCWFPLASRVRPGDCLVLAETSISIRNIGYEKGQTRWTEILVRLVWNRRGPNEMLAALSIDLATGVERGNRD